MKNPFKAVGKAVSGMFTSADNCDFFAPAPLKVGAILVTPLVAPVAFVAALFDNSKPEPKVPSFEETLQPKGLVPSNCVWNSNSICGHSYGNHYGDGACGLGCDCSCKMFTVRGWIKVR